MDADLLRNVLQEQNIATDQIMFGRTDYVVATEYELLRVVQHLLQEKEREVAHWKANHDNIVRKLRLFTQRQDLPVDRIPA